jgi:hypothetical protein
MTAVTGSVAPPGGIRMRSRNQSVWREFLDALLGSPARSAEQEIVEYLHRHRYDLPPEVWIELERRRLGP